MNDIKIVSSEPKRLFSAEELQAGEIVEYVGSHPLDPKDLFGIRLKTTEGMFSFKTGKKTADPTGVNHVYRRLPKGTVLTITIR